MQHCLIIDDSTIVLQIGRLVFESLGFRVSEADSGAAALERVAGDPPDLIVIDWHLPGTNVHEAISNIRAKTVAHRPFILYLTSENDVADLKQAFKAGADDYLLKPFNREIVEMKLHEIRVAA
jgi:two-component system chemotaxis response regulator CheY